MSNSFEGKVTISASNPIEVVAIDVTPGANGSFVIGNVPLIGYNPVSSSYSGTYNFVSGPLAGHNGPLTISNISPIGNLFGEAAFLATATSGSVTGGVSVEVKNNGTVFFNFFNNFTPLSQCGAALTLLPDGSLSGSVFLPGPAGMSVGTITLNSDSSSDRRLAL